MRRLIVVFALVAAACGGSTSSTPDTTGGTAAATASSSDPSPTDEPGTERPRPEGPDAPDFTLALGEGGAFSLSDEQKPVYLVFWAEW